MLGVDPGDRLAAAEVDQVLRALRARSAMPREIGELFFHLKRTGNAAAHEDRGSPGEALTALKVARAIGVWLHQTYAGAASFRPGPFVPPAPPTDATAALRVELAAMRKAVADSADVEAKARLSDHTMVEHRVRLPVASDAALLEAAACLRHTQQWVRSRATCITAGLIRPGEGNELEAVASVVGLTFEAVGLERI